MKINKKSIIIWLILGLIILVPLVYNVAVSSCSKFPEPFLEKPKGEKKCIKDTEYMRFNHMILLKGIRDDVMRQGKKGEMGFKDCRQCHTNRERFCDRCHNMVNLKPNCFSCHYYE
jgi:hypothetical protein